MVFFIYGFSKNEKSNFYEGELEGLKKYSESLLDLNPGLIQQGIEEEIFFKVG